MRFAVAVKQVPDTMEMSVDENGSLMRAGVPSVLNPYDEYVLARVLEMRGEGDEVVVFTMGPRQARQALVRCLEMGADRAYLISDRDFAGADVWATARTLTAFILRFVPDSDLIYKGVCQASLCIAVPAPTGYEKPCQPLLIDGCGFYLIVFSFDDNRVFYLNPFHFSRDTAFYNMFRNYFLIAS